MSVKVRHTLTYMHDDLDEQLYSANELLSLFGLPFIAVKARHKERSPNSAPLGTSLFVTTEDKDGNLHAGTNYIANSDRDFKYLKRFKS